MLPIGYGNMLFGCMEGRGRLLLQQRLCRQIRMREVFLLFHAVRFRLHSVRGRLPRSGDGGMLLRALDERQLLLRQRLHWPLRLSLEHVLLDDLRIRV